jgi:hypothetical protein
LHGESWKEFQQISMAAAQKLQAGSARRQRHCQRHHADARMLLFYGLICGRSLLFSNGPRKRAR